VNAGTAEQRVDRGNGGVGEWGNGEMGKWGNGGVGKWGNGEVEHLAEISLNPQTPKTLKPQLSTLNSQLRPPDF
jgi:hypothetical protein